MGTGDSLSRNLVDFSAQHGDLLRDCHIKILVVAFACTSRGETKVRAAIASTRLDIEFRIADPSACERVAFGAGRTFWESKDEEGRAKDFANVSGSKVHKTNPLGYGNEALLLVFSNTCPRTIRYQFFTQEVKARTLGSHYLSGHDTKEFLLAIHIGQARRLRRTSGSIPAVS